MANKAKIIAISILVLFFLALILVFMRESKLISKHEIEKFVQGHMDALNHSVEHQGTETPEDMANRIQKSLRWTIVEKVSAYGDIIQFLCDGKGLSTNSIYTGFYYSPNDIPYGFEFDEYELQEVEPGIFFWESDGGLKSYYTERIAENWFYYKIEWY